MIELDGEVIVCHTTKKAVNTGLMESLSLQTDAKYLPCEVEVLQENESWIPKCQFATHPGLKANMIMQYLIVTLLTY